MKILITNIHLNAPRGSEMWVATVAKALKRLNHDVHIHAPGPGPFYIREIGDRFPFRPIEGLTGTHYDLLILNHGSKLIQNLEQAHFDKTIVMCHGKNQNAEVPIKIKGAVYMCGSEETKKFYRDKFDFRVIRQPIDPRWFEIPAHASELKTVLWAHHNKNRPDYESLEKVLKPRGIELRKIGFPGDPEQGLLWPLDVLEEYRDCQLVVGFGRWIYQAMAAGRPCVIMNQKGSRLLDVNAYDEFVKYNLTQRCPLAAKPDWESIIEQWDTVRGLEMRDLALKNHHSGVIAMKLLELLKEFGVGK